MRVNAKIRKPVETALIFVLAAACSWGAELLGINKESIIMIYLLGVLFTTVATRSVICGIITSVLSLMLFNFLFTEPRFTFVMNSTSDIILLAFFLVTAIVSGIVTSRLQQQMELAAKNERAAQELVRVRGEQDEIRLAMEREKLRAALLRSVAHDLRSPLTSLSGASRLLADNYRVLPDEEKLKLISDISEEITWLTNLVENILNMTRIGESQLVLNKGEEVIDDVVSEAISHMDHLLRDRKFHVSLPDDVIMVPMDGKLIVQVLINLLENAVRHTPPDAEIGLEATAYGQILIVSVSDTGNGIDEKIRGRLFDRFVTQDSSITDGKRGMGLGLAICKAIVEAHGGNIWVEDSVPHGAKFIFTLPMEEPDGTGD